MCMCSFLLSVPWRTVELVDMLRVTTITQTSFGNDAIQNNSISDLLYRLKNDRYWLLKSKQHVIVTIRIQVILPNFPKFPKFRVKSLFNPLFEILNNLFTKQEIPYLHIFLPDMKVKMCTIDTILKLYNEYIQYYIAKFKIV